MFYKYKLENKVKKDYAVNNVILNKIGVGILHYICYYINTNGNYPFIQFLLEKVPYCENLVDEEFILPSVIVNNENIHIIENIIIEKLITQLNISNKNIEYLGIIDNGVLNSKLQFALIKIQTNKFDLNNKDLCLWFSIPTEIVNIKTIYNIPIQKQVIELFTYNFHNLCILEDKMTNKMLPLPDILYFINKKYYNIEYVYKTYINKQGSFLCLYRNYNNIKSDNDNVKNDNDNVKRCIVFLDKYTCINNKLEDINICDYLLVYNTLLLQNENELFDTIVKDYNNIVEIL
jgi:hypothetical protein